MLLMFLEKTNIVYFYWELENNADAHILIKIYIIFKALKIFVCNQK